MSKDRKIIVDDTEIPEETIEFPDGMSLETQTDTYWFNPALPATAFIYDEKAGRFIVPRFQKMQNYLNYHIAEQIGNRLCQEINCETKTGIPETCAITTASFWREDYLSFIADLSVTIEVFDPTDDNRFSTETYVTQVMVNMFNETVTFIDSFHPYDYQYDHEGYILLSDYLVPILSANAIEEQAEDMLYKLAPKAYSDPKQNKACNLAKTLGLNVVVHPIHNSKKKSTLFFKEGTIQIDVPVDKETTITKRIKIPADTVVMNSNAKHADKGRIDLFHECFHYEWHYCFNKLMELHQRDIKQLSGKHMLIDTHNKKKRSPLAWTEWQARRGAFCLLLPKSIISKKIHEGLNKYKESDWHMGKKLEVILSQIGEEFQMCKGHMRGRATQIGYIEAKGALNYVDRGYIEPFAFDPENGGGNYTFVLDSNELFEVYQKSKKLQKQLFEQAFIYVDGHICKNNPAFVEKTRTSFKLTKWANWHVDQCCLRFIQIYDDNEEEYTVGTLNCDDGYDRYYLGYIDGADEEEQAKQFEKIKDRIARMPSSFNKALVFLMKEYNCTEEALSEFSTLSVRLIAKLRNEERSYYPLDYLVALCVGMKLEPPVSEALMLRAGYDLRLMPQNFIYQFILSCKYTNTIDEIQKFLKSRKLKPLKLTTD